MAGLHEGQSSSDEGSNEPQSFLFNVYNVYNLKELIEYDQARRRFQVIASSMLRRLVVNG